MGIRITKVSKPLIITSVILLFIGSILGSLTMMILFGFKINIPLDLIKLHRIIQIDGFLTIIIMGISYMIIPRFRNIDNPQPYYVYIPFTLVLLSLLLAIANVNLHKVLMLVGITLFSLYILNTLRVKPKLLPISDYYIILAVTILLTINIIKFFEPPFTLQYIQLWLTFPLFMILGIEYKTLPSFIGYINPRISYTKLSLLLASAAIGIGILSIIIHALAILFAIMLLISVIMFDKAVYATHGFDYKNIMNKLNGEGFIRYKFILLHIRLAYLFLYTAMLSSILYHILPSFALYDLSIHLIAIGFIGLTIKLYLPMMLPPIIGKTIRFVKFNLIPLYMILVALAFRIVGMFILPIRSDLLLIIGASGWLIIAALFIYAIMIHKSMDDNHPNLPRM